MAGAGLPRRPRLDEKAAAAAADPTPLDFITSVNIVLYLDAAIDGSYTLGGDNRATLWSDQSDEGNDFSVGAGGGPTFSATGLGGAPCFVATGDQFMARAASNFTGLGVGKKPHVYVLGQFEGIATDFGCFYEWGPTTSPGDGFAMYASGGGDLNARCHYDGQAFADEASWAGFAPPDAGAHLYEHRNATGSLLYVDGVLAAGPGFFPAATGLANACDNASLFDSLGTERLIGRAGVYLVLDDAPTAGELSDLYSWFETRGGLTLP